MTDGVHGSRCNAELKSGTPCFVWFAGAFAALMRSIPFVSALLSEQSGFIQLPAGFIPKDWFVYAAMIRRFGEDGVLLNNPFTTEPQGGRFILLFHNLLGMIHSSTGADPLWLLELSRWPLTLLLAFVLWKFTAKVFRESAPRKWAFFLVMFSGGLEYPFVALFQHLATTGTGPAGLMNSAVQDLWYLYGWNTFQAMFNPLWLCGLIGILALAGQLLVVETISVRRALVAAGGFVALWYIHSYSALAVAGIAAGTAAASWIRDARAPWTAIRNMALMFVPGLTVIAAISLWQVGDSVFARSAGGVLGTQAPSAFWLPLTLGVTGILAVRGWLTSRYEGAAGLIAGWTVAAVLMASSTFINGYHFVFMIHIPVCLAAAPVTARIFSTWRLRSAIVAILLFGSVVPSTVQAVSDVGGLSAVPSDAMNMMRDLALEQPGNVMAPPELGNIIPALSLHKVWVGQWFMTPEYQRRAAKYWKWMKVSAGDAETAGEMVQTLASQHIQWLVIPSASIESVRTTLTGIPFSTRTYGAVSLIGIGH